jgi:hypothetical protein
MSNHYSPSFYQPILVIFSILTIQACTAFVARPFWTKSPSRFESLLLFSSYEKLIADDKDADAKDVNRRKLLSVLQAAPLVAFQPASAQVEVIDVPSPQINAGQKTSSRLICADLEEENRIAIFERVAPSVVYIDTFAEKRDVFSTNV